MCLHKEWDNMLVVLLEVVLSDVMFSPANRFQNVMFYSRMNWQKEVRAEQIKLVTSNGVKHSLPLYCFFFPESLKITVTTF